MLEKNNFLLAKKYKKYLFFEKNDFLTFFQNIEMDVDTKNIRHFL